MAPFKPLNNTSNTGTAQASGQLGLPRTGFTGTAARPNVQFGTGRPDMRTFQSQVPQFPVQITQIFSHPGNYSVLMDFNPCPQHRNNNANNNFISRGSGSGRVGRDVPYGQLPLFPSSASSDSDDSSLSDIYPRNSQSSIGPIVSSFDTSTSTLPIGNRPTLNLNTGSTAEHASGVPPNGQ